MTLASDPRAARRMRPSPKPGALCAAAVASLALAVWAPRGSAQEATPAKAYAREIALVETDLDTGRTAEAKKRLEATDPAQRNFEFEYLLQRAQGAAPEGVGANLIRLLPRPEVESRYAVLNEIDRQLAYIGRDGAIRVYDLNDPKAPPKVVPYPEGGAIWSGAFSRDGKRFFAGHEKGAVVVRDAKTWKVLHTVPVSTDWAVRELAAAPDGSAFVAETKTALELWSLAGDQPKKVAAVGERYNFGEGLAFSPKGDTLATGGMFDILLYNAKTGEKTKAMTHASYTMGLEFSPDGTRIASAPRGNVNKFLGVFDVAQGKALFNAGPFAHYVAGMAFTPDGKRIAATGCEKFVRLFDAATGDVVLTLKRTECSAKPAITRDGRLLGWSEPDGYHYIDLGKKPGDLPANADGAKP